MTGRRSSRRAKVPTLYVGAEAVCLMRGCSFRVDARNAMGLAAQHHLREPGHQLDVRQAYRVGGALSTPQRAETGRLAL